MSIYSNLSIIILAAGKGKRMNSVLPKVLVNFLGKPMINHVIDNIIDISSKNIVVVGYKKEMIMDELKKYNLTYVHQKEQLGTGHAVLVTENEFNNFNGKILVLFGDSPLISKEVIIELINFHNNNNFVASLLTTNSNNPGGAARIIRNKNGTFIKSVENKDLTEELKNIKEINVGVMIFNSNILFETLKKVNNNNSQKEYYLPDVINILSVSNNIGIYNSDKIPEIFAFNTIDELNKAEFLTILK
jgi:UDP-N-acetylglucosamine diphosphorylase/glucosamine-1-phosphate N-acetyltransferase